MPKIIFTSGVLSAFNIFIELCKNRWRYLSLGLAGVLLLEVSFLYVKSAAIKNDITNRTLHSLKQKGFERVNLSVSGRDVWLEGEVSSLSAENLAADIAGSVHGVRKVLSGLDIAPLRLPHFKITRGLDRILKIEGEIPSEQTADELVSLTTTHVKHGRLVNLISIDPEVTDPVWMDLVVAVLAEANQLQAMEMELGAGQLSMGGLLEKDSDYQVMVQRISQFISKHEVEFINRIGVHPLAAGLGDD